VLYIGIVKPFGSCGHGMGAVVDIVALALLGATGASNQRSRVGDGAWGFL
jgi:hypothetical protein